MVGYRGAVGMPGDRANWAAGRVLAAAAVGLAVGCQAVGGLSDRVNRSARRLVTDTYHDPDPDGRLAAAEERLAAGQYEAARADLGDLASNTSNPVLVAEKARFLEAESLRLEGREATAAATYHRLLQDHAAGAYRERACGRLYDIAYGWLRETTLAEAQAAAGDGGDPPPKPPGGWLPNPFDDRRPAVDQEGEAVRYLEAAHAHDPTGPTADKALFWCGYVHFLRGRFDESDHFFSQLVEMHKDSPLRPKALELAVIAKNNSTGGAVYDSQKAAEALKLIHHTEATDPAYANDPEKAAWLARQKMAVRMQLADKDYERARYYERTGHPASAYFVYELIARRYPGTKYSDLAVRRLAELRPNAPAPAAEPPAAPNPAPAPADTGVVPAGR